MNTLIQTLGLGLGVAWTSGIRCMQPLPSSVSLSTTTWRTFQVVFTFSITELSSESRSSLSSWNSTPIRFPT